METNPLTLEQILKKKHNFLTQTFSNTSNLFALSLATPEEVKNKLLDYFNDCQEQRKNATATGLAMALGITREELITFSHQNPIILNLIIQAKQFIIENVEQLLLSGQAPAGFTFWLKNNDNWVEKITYQESMPTMSDLMAELKKDGKLIDGNAIVIPDTEESINS